MNVTARYLSCDPFNHPNATYEAEAFFNNPLRWWKTEYSTKQTPTLVVLFDKLRGRVENILSGYSLLHELPHTQVYHYLIVELHESAFYITKSFGR